MYGETIPQDKVPEATKEAEQFSLYEYEFLYWKLRNIDAEISFDGVIKGDYEYEAVFGKKLREVTITFDAGENGTFYSTGTRTRSITLAAGSVLNDFGETPVYTPEKYYNVFFKDWSYAEPFTFTDDATVDARTKRVRNARPTDEPVGVTISSGKNLKEDIGIQRIAGYEYDPDNKVLVINKAGFTLTSNGEPVDLMLSLRESVTLKDLNITSNYTALTTAKLGTDTSEINVYIEGAVKLSVANENEEAYALWIQHATNFIGIGDAPTLELNCESRATYGVSANKIYAPLSFEDVGLTIDVSAQSEVNVFYCTQTVSFDREVSVTVTSPAVGSVVFFNAGLLSGELFDAAKPYVRYTGCDYRK